MDKYVAFLKGINVGGKNIIKMAELRDVFVGLGYSSIKTYIQSGNIIFKAAKDKERLKAEILQAILKEFGVTAGVILRKANEIDKLISQLPIEYKNKLSLHNPSKINKLYVALSSDTVREEDVLKLENSKKVEEGFVIIDNTIYVWVEYGFGKSKLAANLSKTKTPITVRNWKTINKLHQMIKDIN